MNFFKLGVILLHLSGQWAPFSNSVFSFINSASWAPVLSHSILYVSICIEFWEISLDQSLNFFHLCFPCVCLFLWSTHSMIFFSFNFINVFRLTLQVWVAQTLHIPKKGLTSELALGQLLEVELFESWNILSDKSTFVVLGHTAPI